MSNIKIFIAIKKNLSTLLTNINNLEDSNIKNIWQSEVELLFKNVNEVFESKKNNIYLTIGNYSCRKCDIYNMCKSPLKNQSESVYCTNFNLKYEGNFKES